MYDKRTLSDGGSDCKKFDEDDSKVSAFYMHIKLKNMF